MKLPATPTQMTHVQTLTQQMGKLSEKDQAFAKSLLDQYAKHNGLSEKQWPYVTGLAEATMVKPEQRGSQIGSMSGLIALFNVTNGKLKYPRITLYIGDQTIQLKVAGGGSKTPGHIVVSNGASWSSGNNVYFGNVSPDGLFIPGLNKEAKELVGLLEDLLTQLAENPALVATEYGKKTGNCCFCTSPLTDARSTAAGFGQTCAKNWGLSEQWKAASKKEFAQ
jgi:hypothetical protein